MNAIPPRNGTTVTVTVPNPLEATNEDLLNALRERNPDHFSGTERVEYISWRDPKEGRVCFGVTWVIPKEVFKQFSRDTRSGGHHEDYGA